MVKRNTSVLTRLLNRYDSAPLVPITFESDSGWRLSVDALCDTGAARNSIDIALLDVIAPVKVVSTVRVNSSLGSEKREVVVLEFELDGVIYVDDFTVSDRTNLSSPVLLGRSLLFLEEEE